MKYIFLCTSFLLITLLKSNGQNIEAMNFEALKQRLKNGQDTVFIVNFWATWCKPCVEELPIFENYMKSRTNPLHKVLLVSMDFKDKVHTTLQKFVEKRKLISEVIWLDEPKYDNIIDSISTQWSGALPCTLFSTMNNKIEMFHEGTITNETLTKYLQLLKEKQ